MFFSIIVPVFNAETSLKRCLDSVCNQVFRDFEVIVVDDGSTDKSSSIILEYTQKDPRFYYFPQENGGVSAARNRGMMIAQGTFIVFLDSDDCYKPAYLQSFYELIQAHPDKDHFWCGYTTISSQSDAEGKATVIKNENRIVYSNRDRVMDLYEQGLAASPCNKAFRSSIIHENKLFMREDLSLGEDLLFNFEYLDKSEHTEIIVLNEVQYEYYCFSDNSLNHKYRSNLKTIYDLLSSCTYSFLVKWKASDKQISKYYSVRYYMLLRVMENNLSPNNKKRRSEKNRENKKIIKSSEFKDCVKNAECIIHPLYRLGFLTGNYRFIQMIDRLSTWKRKHVNT